MKMPNAASSDQKYRSWPWPNGCSRSAGRSACRSEVSRNTWSSVSAAEWAASASMALDPLRIPATSLTRPTSRFAAPAMMTVRRVASCPLRLFIGHSLPGSATSNPGRPAAGNWPAARAHVAGCVLVLRAASAWIVAVAAAELLHPAGGVDHAGLAGVERVARGRDLHVNNGVRVAVFPLDRVAARQRGLRKKHEIRGAVPEDNRMIVGMNAWLHDQPPCSRGMRLQRALGAGCS